MLGWLKRKFGKKRDDQPRFREVSTARPTGPRRRASQPLLASSSSSSSSSPPFPSAHSSPSHSYVPPSSSFSSSVPPLSLTPSHFSEIAEDLDLRKEDFDCKKEVTPRPTFVFTSKEQLDKAAEESWARSPLNPLNNKQRRRRSVPSSMVYVEQPTARQTPKRKPTS